MSAKRDLTDLTFLANLTLGLIALALSSACGLINGLSGTSDQPLTAKSWHGPVQIDQGIPAESNNPRQALAQGVDWVAFQEYEAPSGMFSVWLTERNAGGDFAAPVKLAAVNDWDGGSFNPQIVAAESGKPVLAYEVISADPYTLEGIWGARLSDGIDTPASSFQRLDGNSGNAINWTQLNGIAIDEAGTALVSWGDGANVEAVSSANGTGWTSPLPVTTASGAGGNYVNIAAGGNGTGLIAWENSNGISVEPVSYSGSAVTPGFVQPLVNASETEAATVVVAQRGDRGLAVYADGPLDFMTYNDGIWSAPQTIPIGVSSVDYYAELSLAMNDNGEAVVLWRDSVSDGTDGYAGNLQAAYYDGGSWSAPQTISIAGPNRHAWWAQVAINNAGSAVAAWADFEATGTYTRIYADVLNTATGAPVWSGAAPIDLDSPDAGLANQPQNVRYINVALDPAGSSAHVIWMQHAADANGTQRTWANWIE